MFVPLNQTYTFSISEGDSLKKIFKNLEDSYSKARNDLKNLVHKFQDGHSSGRVFDLIEKCLNFCYFFY